jgi:hypothetical protein
MMGIRDQEMVRVSDLQQLYPFRMAVKSSNARLDLAHLTAPVSGYLSRRYIEAQRLPNLFDTQAACRQGTQKFGFIPREFKPGGPTRDRSRITICRLWIGATSGPGSVVSNVKAAALRHRTP